LFVFNLATRVLRVFQTCLGNLEIGLRVLLVRSRLCKAAPKDINWRLTIRFDFWIWRDCAGTCRDALRFA